MYAIVKGVLLKEGRRTYNLIFMNQSDLAKSIKLLICAKIIQTERNSECDHSHVFRIFLSYMNGF